VTAKANAMVAASAGAQAMKPPKLITCGMTCSTADTVAGHRFPVRMLTKGASDRRTRAIAIEYGSGPLHAVTAGNDWQTVGPSVEDLQDCTPPGTNCDANASAERIGAAIARISEARRRPIYQSLASYGVLFQKCSTLTPLIGAKAQPSG